MHDPVMKLETCCLIDLNMVIHLYRWERNKHLKGVGSEDKYAKRRCEELLSKVGEEAVFN
jgi:hypothetical protein